MFQLTNARGPVEARVSQVIVAARVVCYLEVRCPECGYRLFDVPGVPELELRVADQGAKGEGPVIKCKRCANLIEVVTR